LRRLEPDADVFVSDLAGDATVIVRARVQDDPAGERLERDLRLRAHEVLREEGVFA
jgi:hypothetical protein